MGHDHAQRAHPTDLLVPMLQQSTKVGQTEKVPKLESKLDHRVQELIELICNIKAMEEMVVQMKYDTKKAPLGKKTDWTLNV
ncbi:hypothetical protein chiPu_0026173 [Chiloscyllium punctatum]|uniref:NAD(+) ADP-ribosyltransferase n=1 Tax=Chiloscyllium punctatum TaxID=137246 RepID=A0A401THJ6_CHIPU|nr:hypothetical protein [Chiloscyllium punctatum]